MIVNEAIIDNFEQKSISNKPYISKWNKKENNSSMNEITQIELSNAQELTIRNKQLQEELFISKKNSISNINQFSETRIQEVDNIIDYDSYNIGYIVDVMKFETNQLIPGKIIEIKTSSLYKVDFGNGYIEDDVHIGRIKNPKKSINNWTVDKDK